MRNIMWGKSNVDAEAKNARARELRAEKKAFAARVAAADAQFLASRWRDQNGREYTGADFSADFRANLSEVEHWIAIPVGEFSSADWSDPTALMRVA